MFVCYDIRGIQQYIFAVPRIKFIVGGSSLIDQFDRETDQNIAIPQNAKWLYSGGGRGAFFCDENKCGVLVDAIVAKAHEIGLDVRIGMDKELAIAAEHATSLYCCPADNLDGEPCAASGIFPVKPNAGKGFKEDHHGVHPKIWKRVEAARIDPVGKRLLNIMKRNRDFAVFVGNRKVEFLKNVSPDETDNPEEYKAAIMGKASIGSRNRWAIIVMDGNNMGRQHKKAFETYHDESKFIEWLCKMSGTLDNAAWNAVGQSMATIALKWKESPDAEKASDRERVILPFRPLIVGGDDVALICHCSYAIELAKHITKTFEDMCANKRDLWIATDGKLTISAGILFCGTSFPLASGIQYTETLLSGAKKHGRDINRDSPPSCMDWEQLVEGAIDTLAARRNRELRFIDNDISSRPEIRLTRRPYTWSEFSSLEELMYMLNFDIAYKVPSSIRHELLTGLRQGTYGRSRFLARLEKNHPRLCQDLMSNPDVFADFVKSGSLSDGRWQAKRNMTDHSIVVSTDVIDAVLLLEEEARMEQETAR